MNRSNPVELPTKAGVTVRVVRPHEVEWFDAQLTAHHPLGAGRPVGDYLRQIVEREGCPVALLVWGPSCYALTDRDLSIGWSASQRVERLKLVVQNRRFLVLAAKGHQPHLLKQAQDMDAVAGTPFLSRPTAGTGGSSSATCTPSPAA